MKPHADYPALSELPALVHQQRRKLAAYLRTDRELRAANEEIDGLLASAGADAVTCEIPLGNFEVRRAVTRDGRRYATLAKIE